MVCRAALFAILAVLVLASCEGTGSRLHIDSAIEGELEQVSAIDNHAHPVCLTGPGQEDRGFDALPADAIQDPALPVPFQKHSPYFREAWRSLFNLEPSGTPTAQHAAIVQARQAAMRQHGDSYPAWVLRTANTEIMLANRVSMGPGLSPDRFKWVPFVDMFLFPLNNAALKAKDPEHAAFFRNEESLLAGDLAQAHLRAPPPAFEDYLAFVSHTLESYKSQGAVALKFEMAYLRDLAISNPKRENAESVYSIYNQAAEPSADEYKILQDFLFRYIALEAGRLALPVHIHSSAGVGSYFREANANPLALEPLFNDPALRKTKFVLLHGAWPYTREAALLILKPNVYLDFSGFSYLTYPGPAADALRQFLEAAPEKVLYGSDATPFNENVGWEETAWIGSKYGREALGVALTRMAADGEVSTERAKRLVHLVLRENALKLYGW